MENGYLHWHTFLDDSMVEMVRQATRDNRDRFVPTTVTTGEPGHRKSQVAWHHGYQALYDAFTSRIRQFLPDLIKAFPQVPIDPDVEMQMTTHNDGEFFKRHLDNASTDTAMRVLTYVYYYTMTDEKNFTGGELMLETHAGKFTIQPTHNTIVMFPSGLWHEVTPVICPSGRWEDSRMTCNGWVRTR